MYGECMTENVTAPEYPVVYLQDEYGPLAVFTASADELRDDRVMTYSRQDAHGEVPKVYLSELPLADPADFAELHAYLSAFYADPPGNCEPLTLVLAPESFPSAHRR